MLLQDSSSSGPECCRLDEVSGVQASWGTAPAAKHRRGGLRSGGGRPGSASQLALSHTGLHGGWILQQGKEEVSVSERVVQAEEFQLKQNSPGLKKKTSNN